MNLYLLNKKFNFKVPLDEIKTMNSKEAWVLKNNIRKAIDKAKLYSK